VGKEGFNTTGPVLAGDMGSYARDQVEIFTGIFLTHPHKQQGFTMHEGNCVDNHV
jgi:hypothetical protein